MKWEHSLPLKRLIGAACSIFAGQFLLSGNADAAALAPSAHSTRVILLGTGGGPIVRRFRSQPSSLLVADGVPYLIDAGDGTVRQLAWAGFTAPQVRAVFITHHHLDHTAGLASVMAFNTMGSSPHALNIYGPPGTTLMVEEAAKVFSISEHLFAQESKSAPTIAEIVRAHDVAGGGPVYQDERIKVIAEENSHFGTMHLAPQPYGTDKSFSYRIETKDRTVVFTGDTGPSEALVKLASGADVLVSEVIDVKGALQLVSSAPGMTEATRALMTGHMINEHLSPAEVGKIAQQAGVKLVVLTHFVPGADSETDVTTYTAGVKAQFSGPVVAGRDLEEF